MLLSMWAWGSPRCVGESPHGGACREPWRPSKRRRLGLEAILQSVANRSRIKAPRPVALGTAGNVHSRVAAESQQVLQGDNDGVGDGGHRQPDHRPVDRLAGIRANIVE